MTAFERVAAYLTERQGHAYCDDCLSRNLKVTPRQAVQQITSKLGSDPRFQRGHGLCACGRETNKLVVRRRLAVAS